MIVCYDNNQIIMHWAAWIAVVYYRGTTIWEAHGHQSCLCICVSAYVCACGVQALGVMGCDAINNLSAFPLEHSTEENTYRDTHKVSTDMQCIDKNLEQ